MRFTETSGLEGFIEGDRLARTPANTANLSFFIRCQQGILKAEFANYIGTRVGGWNNQVSCHRNQTVFFDREIPFDGYKTIDISKLKL
jgi:iron complex outermembrane receptor protein